MKLSFRDIAEITGGRLEPLEASGEVNGVSTDSRTLVKGDLFVPLSGPRFDGHTYLNEAVRKGAAACLSEKRVEGLTAPVIHVADTLTALGDLAAAVRRGFDGPVLGITGSSGKTTTKEMLADILSLGGNGLKNEGNFNNLIGLPLTLFGLDRSCEWVVLEMGMSQRGEIARLAEIADPSIGVITNIGPAHLESLKGIDGVARAKGELFAAIRKGGTAVVNADDDRVRALPIANGVKRLSFGFSEGADVRAEGVVQKGGSVTFRLCIGDQSRPVSLETPGRHNVCNALAAAAAASSIGVPIDRIAEGLNGFGSVAGRMEMFEHSSGALLVMDTYNANPLSVKAALESFDAMNETGKRIAVLADMLELGDASRELHREVGLFAAAHVDYLILLGKEAEEIGSGAVEGGLPSSRVIYAATHDDAAEYVEGIIEPGSRVLIKGSRGMRMERVAEILKGTGSQTASGKV